MEGIMTIKEYRYLTDEAKKIRFEVFIKEQGFTQELDEIDQRAIHLVMFDQKEAISTCRIYYNNVQDSYAVGRLAVLKQWRGKSIGARLLNAAEECIRRKGGKSIILSAQLSVFAFYEKQGYSKQGEVYYDEDCPHVWMKKLLS